MRLITLVWSHLRVGVLNELQYRVNFFIQLLQTFIALGVGLVGLALVFSHISELNGWAPSELLMVMGVHMLSGGVIKALIFPNMQRLLEEIHEGTLDFSLAKPVDSQVLISIREFRLWQLTDVLMGAGVMAASGYQLGYRIGPLAAVQFCFALLFGAVTLYSSWLMLTCVAFWIVRADEMIELFAGVYAAGRWPVGLYPDWLRTALTFLVPVAFAVTVPAEALIHRLTTGELALAAALAATFLILARLVWRVGLRAYSGASA